MSQDSEQPTISTKDLEKIMTTAYGVTTQEGNSFNKGVFQKNVTDALDVAVKKKVGTTAMADAIQEIGEKLGDLKNEENSEVRSTGIIIKGASKLYKICKVFLLNRAVKKGIKNLKGVMRKDKIIKPKQSWKDWVKEKLSPKGKGGHTVWSNSFLIFEDCCVYIKDATILFFLFFTPRAGMGEGFSF